MFFHVRLIDNPETPEKRGQSRLDHWRYFEDHRDHFIARGATKSNVSDSHSCGLNGATLTCT